MLNGKYKGQDIGSGTDVWRFSEDVRAGDMSLQDFMSAETGMSRSSGVCMTMGTASTMASLVEGMGLSLPTNAAIPAVDARRMALAHMSGKRIVEMVEEGLNLSKVLTKESFENAITLNSAVGGSTNSVVHLLALAGRAEIVLTLEDFEKATEIPLLVNCMPSGKYLMEDFCYAGGIPAVLAQIKDHLKPANTILNKDISTYYDGAEIFNEDVIRPINNPLKPAAGLRILRGNLAPNGAIIKPAAASEHLLKHEGLAYVFEDIEDLKANIDRTDLPVTKDTILVLKGCGPKGYPGMPEVGNIPIPKILVEQGVRDMVRISDGRMSGTAFGTIVLHVSPESYVGGPISIVETGDRIRLDAINGVLELLVPETEIIKRTKSRPKSKDNYTRGYAKLYIDHVMQADKGADFDFLVGKDTRLVTRESH
jgi:dihydroxy-acid dehydratase